MQLIINGQTVDFQLSTRGTRLSLIDQKGQGSDYIIVKSETVLKKAEKKALVDLGIQDLESVGSGCYLCRYRPDDITAVQDLSFIRGIAIYPAECKISRPLEKSIRRSNETKDVRVVLHSTREANMEETVMRVAKAVDLPKAAIEVDAASNYLEFAVAPSMISKLANLDSVRVIEEVLPKTISNDYARHILGLSNFDGQNLLGELPLQGDGQTIAVADTGLDLGNIEDMHPAFRGRVKELIAIGRPGAPGKLGKTDDPHGHGTHVCGSVVGAPIPGSTFGNIKGTAPAAMLVMQSLWSSSDGGIRVPTGTALAQMLLDPYERHDAHIHSNSWGTQWGGTRPIYDGDARIADNCVHDNSDLLICVAAGNTGDQSEGPTIGSLAACKNVLTIGATESPRPSFHGKPLKDASCENDPTEVSWYSARGPTAEQRIKPDVLAPGTPILSTRSRAVTKLPVNGLQPSEDNNYAFAYGTSMATPLVAGCAAVLREFLVKNGTPKPPAALLKALLINGAYSFHHAHNGKEGFGIVNLTNSITLESGEDAGYRVGKAFDDIDQEQETSIQVSGVHTQTLPSRGAIMSATYTESRVTPPSRMGVTLKATLVYTDAPGAILQNNLNLQIKSVDGLTRNGNRGTSKWFDNYNNVEQVIWKGITPGKTFLKVMCRELTSDSQDYALVWKVIPNED